MATNLETIKKIAELFAPAGVAYRKMFGEYALYYDGKIFAYVCDDRLLVKPVPAARKLLPDAKSALPYEGAKPMLLIEDLSDSDFLCGLAKAVAAELPQKKRKER